jgi:hypothetical protein
MTSSFSFPFLLVHGYFPPGWPQLLLPVSEPQPEQSGHEGMAGMRGKPEMEGGVTL